MIIVHGAGKAASVPHPAHPRFIALLDMLGMKSWLSNASPQDIAETVEKTLTRCRTISYGVATGRIAYGPIVGVTHSPTFLRHSTRVDSR